MSENNSPEIVVASEPLPTSQSPQVFISHDSRDAALAEAFSKLLKSVSAGMIKTFRSSDRKGSEGIDFGEEWYKRLMNQLKVTSDVVCLFTERSLDRPWILFEAGVAKGKLDTPVIGLALGVPLNKVTVGPFYQFMNMDDSVDDLTKLVEQISRRISGLELDPDVVSTQVAKFKESEAAILKVQETVTPSVESDEEISVAKLAEELKTLPARIAERLSERPSSTARRKSYYVTSKLADELMSENSSDPIGILLLASEFHDEAPWVYDLARDLYGAIRRGDEFEVQSELRRLISGWEFWMRGLSFADSIPRGSLFKEFPWIVERLAMRTISQRESGPVVRRDGRSVDTSKSGRQDRTE